jgi:hypothetical protein
MTRKMNLRQRSASKSPSFLSVGSPVLKSVYYFTAFLFNLSLHISRDFLFPSRFSISKNPPNFDFIAALNLTMHFFKTLIAAACAVAASEALFIGVVGISQFNVITTY